MATVTRYGNAYEISINTGESVRFDRPFKKIQLGDSSPIEFPSIYGYPITLPNDLVAPNVVIYEYGEVANEHYWEPQPISQEV